MQQRPTLLGFVAVALLTLAPVTLMADAVPPAPNYNLSGCGIGLPLDHPVAVAYNESLKKAPTPKAVTNPSIQHANLMADAMNPRMVRLLYFVPMVGRTDQTRFRTVLTAASTVEFEELYTRPQKQVKPQWHQRPQIVRLG